MDAEKIVNKITKEHGTIKNVYFLACGGSLVDLYPGYYFLRAESAVMDAQWIPAHTAEKQRNVWKPQKREWKQAQPL